jgi:hypothetical protein
MSTAVVAADSSRRLGRALPVAGALLFAIFLVLVWGALRDAASAEGATTPTAVKRRPPVAAAVASAAPEAAPATEPSTSRTITKRPAVTRTSTPTPVRKPAAAATPTKRRPITTISGQAPRPVANPVLTRRPAPSKAPAQVKRAPNPADVSASLVLAGGPLPAALPAILDPQAVADIGQHGDAAPATVTKATPTTAPSATPTALAGGPASPRVPLKAALIAERAAADGGRATTAIVAPPLVNQCNGFDNAGGQAVACTVTVTNTLNLATGVGGSVVTVTECHGAANAPLTCTTSTTSSSQVVTSVTQCNGSGSGGGGTVTCSVEIVNNITGVAPSSPATVNQCNGSGEGGGIQPTLLCLPSGATTGATVTQCNGSGNGGGASIRVQCTVAPSTQTSALPISVNQCNGSGNGGGATVTCTVSVTNTFIIAPLVLLPDGIPPGGIPPGGVPLAGLPRGGIVTASSPGGATSFGVPAGGNARSDSSNGESAGAAGSLALTGTNARSMSLVALLALLIGALFVRLSRRPSILRA